MHILVRHGRVWLAAAIMGCHFLSSAVYAADVDNDGMEDSWESGFGLNPGDPQDALSDLDNDSLNNLGEFLAQTDPTNPDSDGDWLQDGYEVNAAGTDPNKTDTDGDGAPDFAEAFTGFDPLDPLDAGADEDNDGLGIFAEIHIYKTDPTNRDSDGDWLTDGQEANDFGFNPNRADSDGDGQNDFDELFEDDDQDGLSFYAEFLAGTDPKNADTDGDAMSDKFEIDYQLDPLDDSDVDGDPDFDGFTSIQEFRLGSDPSVVTSVPPYLDPGYMQSFEEGEIPELWYTPEGGAIEPWQSKCNIVADDGACVVRSGPGAESELSFMARFRSGQLNLSWAGWTTVNDFKILVDGNEVFSFRGVSFAWSPISIPLTDGVHEITLLHNRTAGPKGLITLDNVNFLSTGLGARPANNSCIAPPVTDTSSSVAVEYPFPEIPFFEQATKILQPPGDPSRWFVLEQTGRVKVFDVDEPEDVRTYLDFSDNIRFVAEGGLLGMAFDPDFPAVPEVYVFYVDAGNNTVISRIILDDTDAPVSPVEQVILTLDKISSYHYSGELRFGPDGMLYTAVGEDLREERAKDTTNLFGSMLRIDVSGVGWPVPGYGIPPGNAFDATNPKCGSGLANTDNCPEIFAWGFRNPWRFSFDSDTGDIWLGDVGNNDREEINRVEVGGNYGWPCYEGTIPGPLNAECIAEGIGQTIPPTIEYSHAVGRAVTAGAVYRGTEIPSLYGRYVFGDLGRPIWEALPDGNGGYTRNQIASAPWTMPVISEGADGELYFASYFNPLWYPDLTPPPVMGKLVLGSGDSGEDPIAESLEDSGCVDPDDPTQPAAGMIPYDINALFWSDNAVKTRFMALPDGTTIDINSEDDWQFPVGSVLMKNFRLGGKLIETRLLMNRLDPALGQGKWEGFSYEWNDDETEAELVVGGKIKNILGQDWNYPSGAQCDACHTQAAGSALGPETAQLNKEYHYPASSAPANQLTALDDIGMFSAPLGAVPADLPALVDPFDASQPLYDRARSYLHTNCSQCHRPGTGVQAVMDFRYSVDFVTSSMCDVPPQHGTLGIGESARLIAPGDAASSVIVSRIGRRDANAMPPIGSSIPDPGGVQLLTEWANSLQSCQEPQ